VLLNGVFRALPNYEDLAKESSWVFSSLVHIPQFLIPFLLILVITRGKPEQYGFNLHENRPVFTHKRMLVVGILVGLIMSLRYIPLVVTDARLEFKQPIVLCDVLGNMGFQWIVVGVCEETMFRGLIQTYLMKSLDGEVMVHGHGLHVGTIVGAVIWGGFHFVNILVMPLGAVVASVILTTAMGLPMGYAYQRTGSLLTTIIVHNTIFGVPTTVGYLLQWLL
jgi:membrane protease YdiL (CAAX protease family)